MITEITDINELNKILRTYLIAQSEVPSKRVRNALSTYGATLDKLLTSHKAESVCECEALVLFELRTRDSDNNVSMTENDDTISYYKSYTLYIIIYGSNSATVAAKLIARLRTEKVRNELHDLGVHIEKVSNDTSMNEFKNEVMWHRHDCEIELSCRMSITQVSTDDEFEILDPVTIIEKETD